VAYLRPQRYTKEFIDHGEIFTLSFFNAAYKKALTYMGRLSGRDEIKIGQAGLTPVFESGTAYFMEAKMALICRKHIMRPYPFRSAKRYQHRRCHQPTAPRWLPK